MASRHRSAAVLAACTVIGALAGIAGAAAAPASHRSARSAAAGPGATRPEPETAVHEDAVVLDKAGTAFITATTDNGTVVSVTGDQLQIKEAAGQVTYKTVTLTIPAGATVVRNFKTAALTDLKAGDHVRVTQSSDGTSVLADDGTARPPFGPGGPRHPGGPGGWGPGGPDGAGGPGWPPGANPPGANPPVGSSQTTTSTTSTTS